jgi:hypothetical protein
LRVYFLTAMFENKFGKAAKYYDEKGWHWMLPFDKPKLFDDYLAAERYAKNVAPSLYDETYSNIEISEADYYENVYECKVENDKITQLVDPLFVIEERYVSNVLSLTKQEPRAQFIEGLYRTDRKLNRWIYCGKGEAGVSTSQDPKPLVEEAYQKIETAKEIMVLKKYEKVEVAQVESILIFIKRFLKK